MPGVSPIVDRNGREIRYSRSYSDFFHAGSQSFRFEQPNGMTRSAADTQDLLPTGSWRQLLSSGRFLFANVPIVRGALLEQALYSFPLQAQYRGQDKRFGVAAEEWLWNWRQNPTFRGANYDCASISRIRMLGYKVDGDIFTVLTFDETGYPRIQLIRAHRVGCDLGYQSEDRVKEGQYRGLRIFNGVIVDDYGRTIAYQVCTSQSGSAKVEVQYVGADSMFPTFRPDYSDEWRGISHLSASIKSFAEHKRLREYEMRAMAIQSSFALSIKNETGIADEASEAMMRYDRDGTSNGAQASLTTETMEDGLIKYFRAGTGSGLELLRPDRPGGDWQLFEEKIIAQALYGTEWDPNFALAIKEPGGAWARTILEKINRCIENNAQVEARAQKRETFYAVNQAIALGILPMPSDGDTVSWEFKRAVKLLTADIGNEQQAKREGFKLGLDSLQNLCTERGVDWEEHREQKYAEAVDLLTRAQQLQAQFPELSLNECLNLLEMRNPNGAPAQPSAPAEEISSEDTEEPKPNPATDGTQTRHEIVINQAPLKLDLAMKTPERKRNLEFQRNAKGDITGARLTDEPVNPTT